MRTQLHTAVALALGALPLAAQSVGFRGYAAMQNHYNLLYREDERDLMPRLA